jgi:hypothetical protein
MGDRFNAWRQGNRQWLNEKDAALQEQLRYYFGPAGERINSVAKFGDMMNPMTDIGESMVNMDQVLDPNVQGWDKLAAGGRTLSNMASFVAPVAGVRYSDDIAAGLTDAFTGISMGARKAATHAGGMVANESGGFKAWHGSPHDFDRFNFNENMGKGEGAQAYGQGGYFGGARETAESYRDGLTSGVSGPTAVDNYANAPAAEYAASLVRHHGGEKQALKVLDGDGANIPTGRRLEFYNAIKDGSYKPFDADLPKGHLYEVNIDANAEDFLDWDNRVIDQPSVRRALGFSDEDVAAYNNAAAEYDDALLKTLDAQPGSVEYQKASEDATWLLRKMEKASRRGDLEARGQDIMEGFKLRSLDPSDKKGSSDRLREAGIPGIRYLDQGSRGADGGTSNYVLFNDKQAQILSKNGEKTARGQAQDVLDLLKAGRGSEVTEEMRAAADPTYLYNNYDLPVDEASRMARASDGGFDRQNFYHGTQRGGKRHFNIYPHDEIDLDGISVTPDSNEGSWYAQNRPEFNPSLSNGNPSVIPVRTRGNYADEVDIMDLPEDMPTADGLSNYDGVDFPMFNERFVFDPTNIRSRYALFDPRLKHLKNLSAGVGGLGLLGAGAYNQPMTMGDRQY